SPVATSFTQSVDPGTGTSCTFSPEGEYHPFFVATANGAAAEVMVRAQKPTFTVDSSACAAPAAASAAANNVLRIVLLIGPPSAKRPRLRLFAKGPRRGPGAEWKPGSRSAQAPAGRG